MKGFLDPTKETFLWVYDKEKAHVFSSTPGNIACQKHYHTFINEMGEQDTDNIEHLYGLIETDASVVVRKIHENMQLEENDKSKFSVFVASMMVRVPNHRINIEKVVAKSIVDREKILAFNKEAFHASYEKFLEDTGTNRDMSAEDIRQFILNGAYGVTTNPQVSLYFSTKSIERIANVFRQMNWQFITSTNEYKYLSSDNPLFYYDPTHDPNSFYGVGLLNKNIEVTLPLSQDICAFGGWQKPAQYTRITGRNQLVKKINKRTVVSALRYVFSSKNSAALLQFISKYKTTSPILKVN